MIGKVGKVELSGMATWLGDLFVSSAGQQEQRQKHKNEAGKKERRQTKEKHKARNKKQSAFTQMSKVYLRKDICTLQLLQNPSFSGQNSLHFVVCPIFLTLNFSRAGYK